MPSDYAYDQYIMILSKIWATNDLLKLLTDDESLEISELYQKLF